MGPKLCKTKPAHTQLLQEAGWFIKSSAVDMHQVNWTLHFIYKKVMNPIRKMHSSKSRWVSRQEYEVAATGMSNNTLGILLLTDNLILACSACFFTQLEWLLYFLPLSQGLLVSSFLLVMTYAVFSVITPLCSSLCHIDTFQQVIPSSCCKISYSHSSTFNYLPKEIIN